MESMDRHLKHLGLAGTTLLITYFTDKVLVLEMHFCGFCINQQNLKSLIGRTRICIKKLNQHIEECRTGHLKTSYSTVHERYFLATTPDAWVPQCKQLSRQSQVQGTNNSPRNAPLS